jgi:hypothetical protein
MTAKEEILRTLESLPDDAGIEEAIDRLYLLYKVQRGLAQANEGQTVSQEEARRRMARWLP